jgi:hypothetical protein
MRIKRFPTLIVLRDGRELFTLQDAADCIASLPKAESDAASWQLAREALLVVAQRGGNLSLAWAAMLKALNRGQLPSPRAPLRIVK